MDEGTEKEEVERLTRKDRRWLERKSWKEMKVEVEQLEDGWRKLRMVGWNGREEEEFLRRDWSEVVEELKVEEVESWDARKRWMK